MKRRLVSGRLSILLIGRQLESCHLLASNKPQGFALTRNTNGFVYAASRVNLTLMLSKTSAILKNDQEYSHC